MKNALMVLAALLAAPAAAAAPPAAGGGAAAAVVAEVNGRAITTADLDARRAEQSAGAMHAGRRDSLAAVRGLVEEEITYLLALEEFERRGYRSDPRFTVPLRIVMDRRLANAYMRNEFLPKTVPTDAEIAAKLPRSWTQLRLSSLYLPTLEEAGEVLALLREGKGTFEELREERSMLTGAKGHGGGGMILPGSGQYARAVEDVLWSLGQGEISPVLDLGFMYAIVRVDERQELPKAAQDEYRMNVSLSLAQQKASEGIARMQEGHTLEILSGALQTAAEDVVGLRWSDPVVARIDGVEITYGDLLSAHPKAPESYLPKLSAGMLLSEYDAFLRAVFADWVAADEARKAGFANPKAEQQLARSTRLLVSRRVAREVLKDVKLTEAEARDFYEKNPQMFMKKEMFTLQSMEFSTRAKAEEAAAKAAKDPEGFTKLREQLSEVRFEERHGKEGLFKDDLSVFPASVRDAIRATKIGGVTGALEHSGKFHVYRVVAIQKDYRQSYESIRWPICRRLLGERRGRAISAYLADLRSKAKVTIDEAALKAYALAVGRR